MKNKLYIVFALFLCSKGSFSQVDEDKFGTWYMYFFNTSLKESSWGFQADLQCRNWNALGDLEQLLIRGGVTYEPKRAKIKFTLGYGDVTTGAYGPEKSTTRESRIYQEALFPLKIGERFYMNHRARYEQRFVQNQKFRTRYRYNLFLNIALTNKELVKNTLYLALYNEIFINGQRNIGSGNTVEIFDRNRLYIALGFVFIDRLRLQLGVMNQTTDGWKKNQFQVSLHHQL